MPKTNIVVDNLRYRPQDYLYLNLLKIFLCWLYENPLVEIGCLSLDHDLGEEKLSGYDLVKILIEENLLNNTDSIQLHTDNMIGFKTMYFYLINARKKGLLSTDIFINKYKIDLIESVFHSKGYTPIPIK